MKLRTKIIIMVLGCVLTALIIQTCLFQNLSSKLIYEQAKEESEQSMQMHIPQKQSTRSA